jgi:hypothetical protein
VRFSIDFQGILFIILIIFLMYLECSLVAVDVQSDYPLNIIKFQVKIPWKIDRKPHRKTYNFYFMYKPPRVMLVTPEKIWNDGREPLNHKKPLSFRCFSHQSGTVGLPIVNESYHAHDRALRFGSRCAAVLRRLYLCEFLELELELRDSECRGCLLPSCVIPAVRRSPARSNPPRPGANFEPDMLQI